jgi:mono/diheme cytochrome c family protein
VSSRTAGGAFVVLFTIVMSACGRPTEGVMRPEQVVDFGTLYDANCAGCHGIDGRHGVAQALNDPAYLALVSVSRVCDVISRGVPGTPMSAFAREAGGTLTDEQVAAVAAGMKRTWGGSQPVAGAVGPAYSADEASARGTASGDPERGRHAFKTYCARCHGEEGQGGPSAGSVVDRAFLSLTSNQALRTNVIVGRVDEGTPGWREYVPGRPMTDQEISDVVAWLASHRGNHD